MNPKISIIVPVYKVENYLKKCIDSILNQTFKDFELILVDDGSPDKCGEICDRYAEKDNRVVVIHKGNGGVSSARNCGVQVSRGEYIGFVDPDDSIESSMYEILFNAAIDNKVDIVVCQIRTINKIDNTESIGNSWKITGVAINKKVIEEELIPDIITKSRYGIDSCVNKLYKKESCDIRFEETKNHGEDAYMNLNLLMKTERIIFLDIPLYNYIRIKRESLTQKFNIDLYNIILENKKNGLYICKKYNVVDGIRVINEEYLCNTIAHLESIANSIIDKKMKIEAINDILNDSEFKYNIKKYNNPNLAYYILKIICIRKNAKLAFNFINIKRILKGYKKRRRGYEN